MSLYYDAASFITAEGGSDSLRLSVYSGKQSLKTAPGRVYALLSETLKWNRALKEVIEASELLSAEHKLTPELALVLCHDLLIRPKGIEAPTTHPLRTAIERHRARLKAELSRLRVRMKCSSLEELKASLDQCAAQSDDEDGTRKVRARWVRVNGLVTTLDEQLETTFGQYERVDSLSGVTEASSQSKKVYVDSHIPDLLAVPWGTDLTGWSAYEGGKIILQDKASCFPAYLLDPQPGQLVVDACAAPGNKTTHLAALVSRHPDAPQKTIYAFERDAKRSKVLQQMVKTAQADAYVAVKSAMDFLGTDPASTDKKHAPWINAEAILLDPSCSGSGIIGRDEGVAWLLPAKPEEPAGKKRKREPQEDRQAARDEERERNSNGRVEATGEEKGAELSDRLVTLATFQGRLIRHAMRFPKARRIVYSTCSVYEEENEYQVLLALGSELAMHGGWHIVPRDKQPEGLKVWPIRGRPCDDSPYRSYEDKNTIIEGCIRCDKHDGYGTQGFFVAALERDDQEDRHATKENLRQRSHTPDVIKRASKKGGEKYLNEEEEWEGFSEEEKSRK